MVVIGGGVIGLELGSVWRRLGAKVTVVEFLDQILPGMDGDVRKEANKIFKKQGMDFKLFKTKVTGAVVVKGKKAVLTLEPAVREATPKRSKPMSSSFRSAAVRTPTARARQGGLTTNQRGQIETDHDFRTAVDGIWAIGDVVPGPMLAHKAEDEGIACAENIAGLTGIVNHDVNPVGGLHLGPEIAGVGLTEEQAVEKAGGGAMTSRSANFRCSRTAVRRPTTNPTALVEGDRRRQERPRPRASGSSRRRAR